MILRGLAVLFSVIVVIALSAMPGGAQTAPRTAWGQPDLGGILDFRTITPLDRPTSMGEKVFLSPEETAALEQEVIAREIDLTNREARRTKATQSVDQGEDGAPGFYNSLWLDGGTTSTGRMSLVIYPPNGRMPSWTPEAQRLVDARREFLSEHPADSWLDRNTSDRCIVGFNAGRPISPSLRPALA